MLKPLLVLPIVFLSACAATAETQEHCTPQWPPGPCQAAPAAPGRGLAAEPARRAPGPFAARL